jgi:hypothetical protein
MSVILNVQSLPSFFSPTCPKAKVRKIFYLFQTISFIIFTCPGKWISAKTECMMYTDLFTTTFSPYLLRFFTVNYALRLNLTILRLNKHRFFKIRL